MNLKYAVLTAGDHLRAWQLACIEKLERSGNAQLYSILKIDHPEGSTQAAQRHLTAFRRYWASLDAPSQKAVPALDLPSVGISNSELIERVQNADLDFVLLFGPKKLGDLVSGIPKRGVWYFVHSDITRFFSNAACFWEIYREHAVTGATLLRITDAASAGVVLKAGYFATLHTSYALNVERAFSALPTWPAQVCSELTQAVASYFDSPPVPQPQRYDVPTALQVNALRLLVQANKVRDRIQRRFFRIDWNVARMQESPEALVRQKIRPNIVPLFASSKNYYLADPCVFVANGKTHVFCEQYLYAAHKGIIVVFELTDGKPSGFSCVIEEPHHLSYPQVFEHNGSVFCVPESADSGKLCLYQAIDFPHKWTNIHTLLEDFAAVDATLLRFEQKWWIFCTNGREGYNSHLYIWYASDLFDKWTSHPKNPVKIDVRSSGSAGQFFTHAGDLYRPAQDCSRTYGGRIAMNRISKLSETAFEESVVNFIEPPPGMYDRGIHAISCGAGHTMVDVKRYVFELASIPGFLRANAGAAARKWGLSEPRLERLKAWLTRER